MKWLRLTLIFFLTFASIQSFSCSGENVGEVIARNENFGRISFIICIVLGVLIVAIQTYYKLFRIWFAVPALVIMILIGHPYNWMGPSDGDCGFALAETSIYSLAGVVPIFVVILVRAARLVIRHRSK